MRIKQRRFLKDQRYAKPEEDEFYAYDGRGERVTGHYDSNGFFVVDAAFRGPGRTDSADYLLDYEGKRVYSAMMKKRLQRRKEIRYARKRGVGGRKHTADMQDGGDGREDRAKGGLHAHGE